MTATAESCLYTGKVMHHRLRPFRHRFVYRVFSLFADLDELRELDRRLRLFSVDRRNLLSFWNRDHGPRDGSALRPWVERKVADAGIGGPFGRISVLCFPRVLGYVFNPLSVYFVHDPEGRLRAILYEVKNTFGEQHPYVLPVETDDALIRQSCSKDFYVSPFIGPRCDYRFRLRRPGERLEMVIGETDADGPLLLASLTGAKRAFSDGSILSLVVRNPAMTYKVLAGIYLEAIRLWWRGAPYFARAITN